MKRLFLSLLLTLPVIGLFGQNAIYTRNIIIDKVTPTLFLKGNGGIINFNTGDVTLTQSANKLTIVGGTLDLSTLPTVNNVAFKTSLSLTATDVGLGNVTNESKTTMFTSPTFTGTPTVPGYVPTSTTINSHALTGNITISATDVGLGNVTNESKATMFTSPTITGTPTITGYVPTSTTVNGHALSGNVSVTATDVSLGNVTNESKATMFTSPAFTGNVPTIGGVSMSNLYVKQLPDTNQVTNHYTLVLTDAGRTVIAIKATTVNITIPLNASVAFPVGTTINFVQGGAGILLFKTPGILKSKNDSIATGGTWSWAALYKRATDEWILYGDISD